VNGGPAGDTIRDRTIPEIVEPWLRGLQNVRWGQDRLFRPRVIGPNVAYSGTQPRFTSDMRFDVDVLCGHAYGDLSNFPAGSYTHMRSYAEQAKPDWWICSEIDCDDPAGWLTGMMGLGLNPAPLAVIWLDGSRFIEGFGDGGTKPTQAGLDVQRVLRGANSRHRSAGGK